MGLINRFLEIEPLPSKQLDAAHRFSLISLMQTFAFALADTFLILFLLDFLDYFQLGIVLAIRFGITAVLDFPTGSLGDHIGYGRVLRIAYIFLGAGGIVLALSHNIIWVIVAYALLAIGSSQLSGALESWFDNNYRVEGVDDDKKIYGSFKARLRSALLLVNAGAFVIGGIISILYSRRILIFIHAFFVLLTFILIIKLIPTIQPTESHVLSTIRLETWKKMKSSLSWVLHDKQILFMFLGFGFIYGVGSGVWYNQILFPYYFIYSKNDFNTGIIRSANFLLGFIWTLFIPAISKRIVDERKPFLLAISWADPVFFLVTWAYYVLFPPTDVFVLATFIGVIVMFQAVGIGDSLSEVLYSRIMIKEVPDDIRNSVYSLLSTIITVFSIPFTIIGGWFIETYGFANGILFCSVFGIIGVLTIAIGFKISEDTILLD